MSKIGFQSVSEEEAEEVIASMLKIPIEKVKRVRELVEVSGEKGHIREYKGIRQAMKEKGLTPRKIFRILGYF